MAKGLVSLPVIVCTVICGDGFEGGGASVCPGNAGFGFRGTAPAKAPCAYADASGKARIERIAVSWHASFFEDFDTREILSTIANSGERYPRIQQHS
jgi:hypothetical protein